MRLANPLRRVLRARFLLSATAATIILSAACGGSSPTPLPPTATAPAATSTPESLPLLSVDEGIFTWSPQWQPGDARAISVQALVGEVKVDTEGLSEEAQAGLDQFTLGLENFGKTMAMLRVGDSHFTVTEVTPDGAVGDLRISTLVPPGDFQGIAGYMDAPEFLAELQPREVTARIRVDRYGEVTGIVNIDEVAGQLVQLASDLEASRLGEAPPQEDMDTFIRLLQTESGKDSVQALVEAKAGHLFLLRPGEYRVGETVETTLDMPTSVGQVIPANAKYVLTGVTDGIAHIDVTLTPSPEGLYRAYEQMAAETSEVTGEPSDPFPAIDSEEGQQGVALFSRLLSPYTVKLQVDTATGWITSAEWTETFPLSQNPPAHVAVGFTTAVR